MSISIEYRLVGTGWSECSIILDGHRIEITGSYLSDCLGGLADAAVKLRGGAASARCSFDEEPGEYRWILERDGTQVHVRILSFPELWGNKPDGEGDVLLDGRCELADFVTALCDAMQRVLDTHGEGGYRHRWAEHEFPTAQLRALREGESNQGA